MNDLAMRLNNPVSFGLHDFPYENENGHQFRDCLRGGFWLGLLLMIAVSAGTFACVLALPAHSLHDAHQIDALE